MQVCLCHNRNLACENIMRKKLVLEFRGMLKTQMADRKFLDSIVYQKSSQWCNVCFNFGQIDTEAEMVMDQCQTRDLIIE